MNVSNLEKAVELSSMFEGRIADILVSSNDTNLIVGPLKATLELYTDSIEVNRKGWSYDGWLSAITNYFNSAYIHAIDPTGQLQRIADEYTSMDLKPFYDEYVGVEPRDIEMLAIKRRHLNERLDRLLNR